MTDKKGELSLTFIILAVIGLLVLAVIVYLIAAPVPALRNTVECGASGGKCVNNDNCVDGTATSKFCTDDSTTTTDIVCCPITQIKTN